MLSGGDLVAVFGDEVAVYLILAREAPAPAGVASTVVDATGAVPRVLRPGAISQATLLRGAAG
jgi:tRNA A37 threonylcarbamoyladenosine synthetase subunit TsaC/SUA5/YrdC